jgi:hypothetical protein
LREAKHRNEEKLSRANNAHFSFANDLVLLEKFYSYGILILKKSLPAVI